MTRTRAPAVFAGSRLNSEELLVLAEFLAPAEHFVSDTHRCEAAANLAEWADAEPELLRSTQRLASLRGCRATVVEVLREAQCVPSALLHTPHRRVS